MESLFAPPAAGTATVSATLKAGCDVESAPWPRDHPFGTGGPYIKYAPTAVRSGELPEAALDAALRNTLGLRFKLGLFDPIDDQPLWNVPPSEVRSDANVAAAVDATEQALVLLSNGGAKANDAKVLPFKAGSGKVAVVGPHANDHSTLLGNYLGQICPEGFSSRACVESPFEAISAINGAGLSTNATGCAVNSTDASAVDAALAAANGADSIVFMGGLDVTSVEREGKDRYEVGLPGLQPSLLRQMLALGKPTVLILFHGGIVTLPPDILESPNLAVVSAGCEAAAAFELSAYSPAALLSCSPFHPANPIAPAADPGFFGSAAIARALFDRPSVLATNRWGKTPVTWYSESGWADANFDMLSFDMAKPPGRSARSGSRTHTARRRHMRLTDRPPCVATAHRYYTGKPQWPFGFGLSYSSTSLAAHPSADAHHIDATVTNDDAVRATDEVVFLFVAPARGTLPAGAPAAALRRTLVSFHRIGPIAPGAAVKTTFSPVPRMVHFHNIDGKPRLHAGEYEFFLSTGDVATEVRLRYWCDEAACRGVSV